MSTVTLSKPITVIDQTFTTLTFREPTGADLVACGYPMRFVGGGKTEIDTAAMAAMIGRLAGVPRTAVDALPLLDWAACMSAVTDFFGIGAATSSTGISSAAGSGATSPTP